LPATHEVQNATAKSVAAKADLIDVFCVHMKAARKTVKASPTPKAELEGFIAKFMPDVAKVARSALAKIRKLTPGAHELVYDNYNALAIGFSPTEKASDVIVSIALYPRWVTLFFLAGKGLPDPKKRLKESGARVRHIKLESAKDLDHPDIRALFAAALERAKTPLDAMNRGKLLIKSVSPKQRPRRPAT